MEKTSLSILKQFWGYDKFRPLQEEIVHEILLGKDTLGVLPTGGGKSICFQVPSLVMDGICVVISPLIALIKDQVENLRKRNIPAVAVFSGMSKREVDIALDNCVYGNIKFLYLSPERLYSDIVIERLRFMNISLFAIDEAHCISQWGYDFRPAYLELIKLREINPKAPFLALTASATPKVVEDIQEKLGFKQSNVFLKSFKRENLGYMAFHEDKKMERMLGIIKKMGGSGVVYVRNRRETQEIALFLINHGISADFYHAGLDMPTRNGKQDAWMQNKVRVIVATNAFGMGIDKSDVRFVIHLDLPDSLEAYYQEAGRAGRDGKKAFPVLLYQQADRDFLWENIDLSFPDFSFIQQCYHYLCNYFQIAIGAGKSMSFDFDVVQFANKYSLNVVKTISALKFLERDKWISLSEAIYLPIRFKFEVEFQELYKFRVSSAKYDNLIKLMLRSYGGIFDYFVNINVFDLAKSLRKPFDEIIHMLQMMQQYELGIYLEKTEMPQLQFLQSRVDYKNLFIDMQFIAERKGVKQDQISAVYEYLDTKECRSIALQKYFGENTSAFCGECDLCLTRKHKQKISSQIEQEIQNVLLKQPQAMQTLIDSISTGKLELRVQTIQRLIESGKIIVKNGLYEWEVF